MSALPDISAANFDAEVLQGDKPVLVDFYGHQCPACVRMLPIMEEIAEERAAQVRIVKINAHDNLEIAARYRHTSVPGFILLKAGQPIGQRTGSTPKAAFLNWLDSSLS